MPSSQPSALPSVAPTTGLVHTYNTTEYSSTGNVVLGFDASVEAGCCLCTEAAIDAVLLTYAGVIIGEIKLSMVVRAEF